jgi:hypothetical protein
MFHSPLLHGFDFTITFLLCFSLLYCVDLVSVSTSFFASLSFTAWYDCGFTFTYLLCFLLLDCTMILVSLSVSSQFHSTLRRDYDFNFHLHFPLVITIVFLNNNYPSTIFWFAFTNILHDSGLTFSHLPHLLLLYTLYLVSFSLSFYPIGLTLRVGGFCKYDFSEK